MLQRREIDTMMYKSLTKDQKNKLRRYYLMEISDVYYDDCSVCFFCCNSNAVEQESFFTDKIDEIMVLLIAKSSTRKLFYGRYQKDEIEKTYDMVVNTDVDIKALDIKLLAQTLILTINNNERMFLPKTANQKLFGAYLENNRHMQEFIVSKMPFAMNDRDRDFFVKLKTLIYEVDKNGDTTLNDLLHIFGPITVKGSYEDKNIFGYHRMVILSDILDVDFENVNASDLDCIE